MKDYFKYDYGYVNVNDNCLYLTNSGNWSDTEDLAEKSVHISVKNTWRNSKTWLLILSVSALVVAIQLKGNSSGGLGFVALFGIAAGYFAVYQRFRSDMGPTFKIPMSKITQIDLRGNVARIVFRDGDGDEDVQTLSGVSPEGLEILKRLPLNGD